MYTAHKSIEDMMSDETTVQNTEDIAALETIEAGENAGDGSEQNPDESAQSDTTQGESEQAGEAKHKGGFQRRIDRLTREKAETARELEYWRKEALRTKEAEKQPEAVKVEAAKPSLDSYGTYEEYIEALTDWKAEQAITKRETEAAAKAEKAKAEAQKQTLQQKWDADCEKAREVHDDFDDVAFNPAIQKHITPEMASAVTDSEIGPELAYYLGQHAEEVQRIAKLSKLGQVREIGKLEARLAKETPAEAKEPPVSKAPKPPSPVSRASTAGAKALDDPSLSFKEYCKAREAQAKRN